MTGMSRETGRACDDELAHIRQSIRDILTTPVGSRIKRRDYGSLLPFDVAVRVPIPGAAPVWRRITQAELPWQVEHARALDRERALAAHCERSFGFTPLAAIDLTLSGSPVRCSASSGEPVTRCGRSSRRSRASPPPARNSNAPTPRAS